MRQHFILFLLIFLYNIFIFSSDLERSFVPSSSSYEITNNETTYPYRDNCCAVCVQRVLGDEDEFHPSRLRACVRTGCLICTGCVAVSFTLIWFASRVIGIENL